MACTDRDGCARGVWFIRRKQRRRRQRGGRNHCCRGRQHRQQRHELGGRRCEQRDERCERWRQHQLERSQLERGCDFVGRQHFERGHDCGGWDLECRRFLGRWGPGDPGLLGHCSAGMGHRIQHHRSRRRRLSVAATRHQGPSRTGSLEHEFADPIQRLGLCRPFLQQHCRRIHRHHRGQHQAELALRQQRPEGRFQEYLGHYARRERVWRHGSVEPRQ